VSGLDSDLEFRTLNVGASEVAALFDASPFLTRFELYHRKRGTISTPDFGGNERIEAGIRLEPAIIEWACDKWGYTPLETPLRLENGKGFAGHPDKFVNCPERGKGIREVKTADWLVAKKWGDEPPLHYQLQAQAYAGLSDSKWCDLIILVGGNELRRFQMDFKPAIYADMERRVVEFWQSVRAGDAPPPDFARDGDAIVEMLGEPTEETADLRGDNSATDLADEYMRAKEAAKAADLRADVAKAELLFHIGNAGFAMLPMHRISCGQTKGSKGTLITPKMVGTYVGARKGWRQFTVKDVK
jgi:predicted phage-related endonuclease